MEIIVVGCGRVGAELSYRLFHKGHKVSVIDIVETAFSDLPNDFRGRTLVGEAMDQELLHRAGIEKADGIAVVTSSDTLNAVVGHIAKSIYHVPSVVVRSYDSRWRNIYEAFELQVISSASWGAQRIEELLYHKEVRTVFSAGNGEVEIYEITIPPEWAGRRLCELMPDQECSLNAVTRAGRAMLPDCDMPLQAGDFVLISATLDGLEAVQARLNAVKEEKG